MISLSILICTVEERKEHFEELYSFLQEQAKDLSVEILFIRDNKEMSVGAKRQLLLEKAQGDYVVSVDDDDWVSDDYVSEILHAISAYPDSVGFEIECSGTKGVTASASNRYKDWAEQIDGFDYVRTPYHKTPIKREIALQIGFNDMRFGEDADFSKRLKNSGLIKHEVYIPKVLYYYQYTEVNPKEKYGIHD